MVVVIDGESDPTMGFEGLTTLMRLARIDLGVVIDIDLKPLFPNELGLSQAHLAIGSILYGEHDGVVQEGRLIYVKASLTGAENPYVRRYRQDCPAFPHQTTADQFFREVQFEAYRALGEQVGAAVLQDASCREVWDKIGFVEAGQLETPNGRAQSLSASS